MDRLDLTPWILIHSNANPIPTTTDVVFCIQIIRNHKIVKKATKWHTYFFLFFSRQILQVISMAKWSISQELNLNLKTHSLQISSKSRFSIHKIKKTEENPGSIWTNLRTCRSCALKGCVGNLYVGPYHRVGYSTAFK